MIAIAFFILFLAALVLFLNINRHKGMEIKKLQKELTQKYVELGFGDTYIQKKEKKVSGYLLQKSFKFENKRFNLN